MTEEAKDAAYGRGDRANYYGKWDKIGTDAEAEAAEEEKLAKEASDAALGLANGAPRSEAEKKDAEKREALKKMKEVWERRQVLEEASKFTLADLEGEERELTAEDFGDRRVLLIRNCRDCRYTLGAGLTGLIKVFAESSQNLGLVLRTSLITSHVELSHVDGLDLSLEMPLQTLQLDLCTNVAVRLRDGLATASRGRPGMAEYVPASPRIVHAGLSGLTLVARDFEGNAVAGAPDGFNFEAALEEEAKGDSYDAPACPTQEVQWVTQPHATGGAALAWETARLVRVGERFLTPRELEAERALMPLDDRSIDVKGTAEGAMNTALQRKEQGNEAFKGREYMQAMALYTMAIEAAPAEASVSSEENGGKPLVAVCRANRAACFLKLGQPEKALEDAAGCVELAPTFAKGHFRMGMAHHAMDSYDAAMPHLLRARDLAPRDAQIKEAIKFCEFRAVEARRKASQGAR